MAKARAVQQKRSRVVRRKRRAVLPRVLVLAQPHVKAPYAAIQVQMAGGKVATYVLGGSFKAVR